MISNLTLKLVTINMKKSSFSLRFQNLKDKINRQLNLKDESLDQIENEYKDSVNSINRIINKLNKYKDNPNKVYNPLISDLQVHIDEPIRFAPKPVKTIYNDFRDSYPLLTGEENVSAWINSSDTSPDKSEFLSRVDTHINFLESIKDVYEKGLDDIENVSNTKDRLDYMSNASEQRGDDSVEDSVELDMKPSKIRSELIDKLNQIEEDIEDEDKKDDNIRLMTDREFIHYIIEYLKDPENRTDQYDHLRKAHPEQCRIIEENIRNVDSLYNLNYNKDELFRLNDKEIHFIENQVESDRDMTLEYFERQYEKNI